MVSELDFEEIDQALEDMNNLDGITNAIAEDVAKIDNVEKKTTPKKSKAAKKTVVKNTTNEVKPKSAKPKKTANEPIVNTASKTKDDRPEEPKSLPEPEQKSDNEGEVVMVKVKKKPAPEPEEVVFQPNPKTGKFMDIVSPLSDMSIKGARPLKNDMKKVVDGASVVTETSAVEIVSVVESINEPVVPEPEPIEIDNIIADRERIENSGLDPDESIGNLTDQLESMNDDESNDPLNDILQNFDSDPVEQVATEAVDEMDNDLEKLADILDIPDHSDSFLENVEIAKRPLGGGEETIGAIAVAETGLNASDIIEAKADKEFIEDAKNVNDWFDDKKEIKPQSDKKVKKKKANKPVKKTSNVVLYVLLIVLFVILGASLGVLAYFSGLF